jgi:hypothetical protein
MSKLILKSSIFKDVIQRWNSTDVSEEYEVSIITVEE